MSIDNKAVVICKKPSFWNTAGISAKNDEFRNFSRNCMIGPTDLFKFSCYYRCNMQTRKFCILVVTDRRCHSRRRGLGRKVGSTASSNRSARFCRDERESVRARNMIEWFDGRVMSGGGVSISFIDARPIARSVGGSHWSTTNPMFFSWNGKVANELWQIQV